MRRLDWLDWLDWLALVTVVAAACGGGQKAAEAQKAVADSAANAAIAAGALVDTVKPAPPLDSSVARKKASTDGRLRDSALAPRFEIGPDGKVRPIKKPGS